MTQLHWLVDFDDTLCMGLLTWGYNRALPGLIKKHALPFDRARFDTAILVAQEQANHTIDPVPVIDDFLKTMGWPRFIGDQLMQEMQENYRPELFSDTIPFLEKLRARGQQIYIVSNNPRTPDVVEKLGLSRFITGTFTPHTCPDTQPKPHRSLWDYIARLYPEADEANTVIVGDDPWSDGLFSENCGLRCWLVDRHNRFESEDTARSCVRIQSLVDIPVD